MTASPRTAQPNAAAEAPTLDLGLLAKRINDEAGLHAQLGRQALRHAREAGLLLLDAKRLAGHGRFMAWVAENCEFGHSQALAYMALARRYADDAKFAVIANSTLAKALTLAAECPDFERKASGEPISEEEELEAFRRHVAAHMGLSERRRQPWPIAWLVGCVSKFNQRGPHLAVPPAEFCTHLDRADIVQIIEAGPRFAEWVLLLVEAARQEQAARPVAELTEGAA